MTYECSGPTFRALMNPYTGEPLRVVMLVAKGGVMLRAPGAYWPGARTYADSREAWRAWNRVDGVEGGRAASGDGVPRCAWTGEPLELRHVEGGVTWAGGFNPTVFLPREVFLRYAEMRDGRSPRPAAAAGRVDAPAPEGRVTAGMRRHVEERSGGPDEETLEKAAEISRACGAESPTVSMHVPAKRKRGR